MNRLKMLEDENENSVNLLEKQDQKTEESDDLGQDLLKKYADKFNPKKQKSQDDAEESYEFKKLMKNLPSLPKENLGIGTVGSEINEAMAKGQNGLYEDEIFNNEQYNNLVRQMLNSNELSQNIQPQQTRFSKLRNAVKI